MSTYYYLVCDTHRARSFVGRESFLGDMKPSPSGLKRFLEDHAHCTPSPVLVTEHDDRTTDYQEVEETCPSAQRVLDG